MTLDTWTDDHPFLQKFIEGRGNGPTLLKPAFREVIDFHDSQATTEVRIADVIASVLFRATIRAERLPSYRLMRALSLEPSPYRLVEWTTNRRPWVVNPYLSIRRDSDS